MGATLISAEELARRIGEPGLVVLHAGCGAADDYAVAHLPRAPYLDTGLLERAPSWRLRPASEIAAVVEALGVGSDTVAVVYGHDRPAVGRARGSGILASCRVALALAWLGVPEVRLLDGGLESWRRVGGPVESGPVVALPAPSPLIPAAGRPELIASADDVAAAMARGDAVVDVRTQAEHVGSTTGYPFVELPGRIPGSIWAGGGEHAHDMGYARRDDGTMRPLAEIASHWSTAGLPPTRPVIFACGTSWRAAEAWIAACTMGRADASVYDGGWLDWSSDERRPVASGIPGA